MTLVDGILLMLMFPADLNRLTQIIIYKSLRFVIHTLFLSLIETESPQSDPLSDEDLKSKAGQEAATANQDLHFQKK
jgi:hypothetical protein